MTPEQNLLKAGLALPEAPMPVGSYVPWVRTGDLVFVSGQIPTKEGKLVAAGKVGGGITIEQASEAARIAVLNCLAQAAVAARGLSNIRRIVRLGVFVNSADGFTQQARVANGASDLLVGVFGDAGRHARFAVGCNELPLDAAVEIEMIAEIGPPSGGGLVV